MSEPDRAVEVVRRLMAGSAADDAEHDALLAEFESMVPDPRASDLLYWPNEHPLSRTLPEEELTAERIVELARLYRPTEL